MLPKHVHNLLTNVFYTGVTMFQGVQYPGNHEPLIDKQTFEEVQTILKGKLSGERSIKHDHYLKSTLVCGQCESRMSVQKVRNAKGDEYFYYACLGRHTRRTDCELRAIQVDRAEELIQHLYDRLTLTSSYRVDLEAYLQAELEALTADSREQHEQLTASQQAIQRKQQKLLEAHYNDAISVDMLRKEQKKLDSELVKISQELDTITTGLDDGQRLITQALNLAQHASSTYKNAPDQVRRLMNQTFFKQLLVVVDDHGNHRIDPVFTPGYGVIFSASVKAQVSAFNATQADSSEAGEVVSVPQDLDKGAKGTVRRTKPNTRTAAEDYGLADDSTLGKAKEARRPLELAYCLNKTTLVDLRSSFSNPRKPLGSLISRVLRGSRARRPRTRGAQIADERGPVRENSRQSQTRLSVSNRAELIAGYADGVPVRELATRFNVHRGTVREIARQAGLAARRPELPDATRQDAAQLYAGGLTLAQVAARLAVSTEAVRSAVIASGGTIRAGGRRRVGA